MVEEFDGGAVEVDAVVLEEVVGYPSELRWPVGVLYAGDPERELAVDADDDDDDDGVVPDGGLHIIPDITPVEIDPLEVSLSMLPVAVEEDGVLGRGILTGAGMDEAITGVPRGSSIPLERVSLGRFGTFESAKSLVTERAFSFGMASMAIILAGLWGISMGVRGISFITLIWSPSFVSSLGRDSSRMVTGKGLEGASAVGMDLEAAFGVVIRLPEDEDDEGVKGEEDCLLSSFDTVLDGVLLLESRLTVSKSQSSSCPSSSFSPKPSPGCLG